MATGDVILPKGVLFLFVFRVPFIFLMSKLCRGFREIIAYFAQDIITEVIEEIDDETEYAQAFLLAERKYRSISHLDPEVSYRRVSALLARKGYGHGLCARIMRELTGVN